MSVFSRATEAVKEGGHNLGSVLSGSAASQSQYKYQKRLMAKQYAYNVALQDDSQEFNAEEAQKTRDYETEMSNSAYQRQKADLLAAGYNPLLAINGGGADTPTVSPASSSANSVSSGQAQAVKGFGLGDVMSIFSTFGALAKLGSEIRSNNSVEALNNAHADLLGQQSEESSAKTALYSAQAEKQALENANFDSEAFRRKQKYGDGPFGLAHTVGGVADVVAKGTSNLVDKVKSLGNSSANSAKGANDKIHGYEDELGKILDKVLDKSNSSGRAAARAASSWLPSHF